jgi:sugar phosphate permease
MPTYVHDHFKQNLAFAGFTASFFAQSGSFAGAIFGGWSADAVTRRHRGGRMIVQGGALLLGLPFVVLTGAATSLVLVIVAFVGWGFFKGMYDANIFASMFDVTPPEIRGTVVGVMNMAGWLFGAGTAPVLIGYIAERTSLSTAISSAALVYGVAAALLFVAAARNRASQLSSAGS